MGLLMINRGNRILIASHLYCCSKHKLSTILVASVASLASFVKLTFWFKTLFKCFCVFCLYSCISFMIGLPLWDTVSMNLAQQTCCTPLKKNWHITPLPPHNGHFSTTATFFCPQGGLSGEVPLYKWKRQKFKDMFVSGSLNPAMRQPISGLLLNIPREDDPHAVSTAGNRLEYNRS